MEIEKYKPCKEAIEYRKQFASFEEAWEQCPRGDWMLWLAQKLGVDKRKLTLVKGLCANTIRHMLKDKRGIDAIDIAIKYGKGKATDQELKKAAKKATAAATDSAKEASIFNFNQEGTPPTIDSMIHYNENYAAEAADAAVQIGIDASYVPGFTADAFVFENEDINVINILKNISEKKSIPLPKNKIIEKNNKELNNQIETSDICRKILTDDVFEKIKSIKK